MAAAADTDEVYGHGGFPITAQRRDRRGVIALAYAMDWLKTAEPRTYTGAGQPEAQANARLIAAAPELLTELRLLVESIEGRSLMRPESLIGGAKQAIDKAEGRA